jgi:hypothetical protein
LAKQSEDSNSLETTLSRAREIAEELGETVIVYFIDMAILEARKNPPTAIDYPHLESIRDQKFQEGKQKQLCHSGSKTSSLVLL